MALGDKKINIIQKLSKDNLIQAPRYVVDQLQYLAQVGSESYGVSNNSSDIDLVGICIPNKDIIFPHLSGEIYGFGKQHERFNQWQKHHIEDGDKSYDITIYNIVKYFQLCMENNPNMLDSLFVPRRCILHSTHLSEHLRENRRKFLHAGAWHKFKGYAYSQVQKMKNKVIMSIIEFEKKHNVDTRLKITYNHVCKEIEIRDKGLGTATTYLDHLGYSTLQEYRGLLQQCKEPTKRKDAILKHGYDLKFAYHVVRLLGEVEQILTTGDLDIEQDRNRLKSIRRGEWTMDKITKFFEEKEKTLEEVYTKTKLPYCPDEHAIKALLLECLEMHFGSLSSCVNTLDKNSQAIRDIKKIVGEL